MVLQDELVSSPIVDAIRVTMKMPLQGVMVTTVRQLLSHLTPLSVSMLLCYGKLSHP